MSSHHHLRLQPLLCSKQANYSDGRSFAYTYDAVGNRLSQTVCVSVGNCVTTNYTYDAANRLATVNGVAQTWDKNGNPSTSSGQALTQDNTGATYTYDSANRLKTLTQGATTSSYVYNGLGDRLQQTVSGVTTTYTLDLTAGLTQVLADGTNTYLYGNGRIAQNSTANGKQYFLGDALGSVRQLVSASGAVTLTRSYEPYGSVLTSAASAGVSTAYSFTGEWGDASGLLHLRARYYASSQGRFLTRDVWPGDYNRPPSLNRWTYAEGNPVNFVDRAGLQATAESTALRIIADTRTSSSDAEALIQLFAHPDLLQFPEAGLTAAERLEFVLNLTSSGEGVHFKMGFGDTGFRCEFQDSWLYEKVWGLKASASNQVGHFLTAAHLGYDMSFLDATTGSRGKRAKAWLGRKALDIPANEPLDVTAKRLIIGHEQVEDAAYRYYAGESISGVESGANYGIGSARSSWIAREQYQAASYDDVAIFDLALAEDALGNISLRDDLLRQLLVSPNYGDWGIGNSLQDLRLSLKGYRFGKETRAGSISTLERASWWLRTNLTYVLPGRRK